MTTYKEALNKILKSVIKKKTKLDNHLTKSSVLFKDLKAKRDNPAYNNSLLDGFAFKSSDTKKNKSFKIISELAVGEIKNIKYKKNHCYRISTGAKIIHPYDCVIPYEKLQYHKKIVKITSSVKKFSNVRLKGADFKKGEVIVKKNIKISSSCNLLIKSSGNSKIEVYKKPKIVLFCSGDEISDKANLGDKVINSIPEYFNSFTNLLNFEFQYLGIVKDNKLSIKKIFKKVNNLKDTIIVSTGGVSAGHKDYFPKFLQDNKYKILFHKLKMQPGRPTLFAKKGTNYYFGLPGNPISTIVGFHFLIAPLILNMQNKRMKIKESRLLHSYKKNKNNTELRRGFLNNKGIKILPNQESFKLSNLSKTNSWLILNQNVNLIKKGQIVKYIDYEN